MTRLLLLDLDGVVRHFDPHRQAAIERRHGLASGALWATAFDDSRGHAVITGAMPRAEWIAEIDAELGTDGAAAEWLSTPGAVDPAMRTLIEELRGEEHRVVVLTNGTDTIAAELEREGVAELFDAVYCSAELGVAKPAAEAFERVLAEEAIEAGEVVFFDDSARNVDAARALGIDAHVFESAAQVREVLVNRG